ncbi:hypothetical protein LTR17_003329 [Elasticomyces elasticus]|nr:hypothetical protein LTR17_003329 [Elasticomyces elasticus]
MASQYTTFLNNPTAALLADDASLVYVTTTTEIRDRDSILKHIAAQEKQASKKSEKVLNVVASHDGACFETEITLQFKAGGGAYLPGLDDNLLDEKVVNFPLVHVVRLEDQKIKQIRLYWDQGTLLRQVEAIGKSGRNWPIKDGQAQIHSINKSLKAGGSNTDVSVSSAPQAASKSDIVIQQHKKRESVSATNDPHASLALFAQRDPNEQTRQQYDGPKTAPRESYKAPNRGLNDILASEDGNMHPRDPSPSKVDKFHKAGAGKHHVNNRLFDENEPSSPPRSPERKKVFKDKNGHFEFGDGEDAAGEYRPTSARGSKKVPTQVGFAAFSVSPSVKDKTRPDYDRHWGDGVQPNEASPIKRSIKHAPREENESHFSIANSSPATGHEKSKSLQRQKGMGLYQDPLHADERTAVRPQTATNRAHRNDNFINNTIGDDKAPMSALDKAMDHTGKNLGTYTTAHGRGDLDSQWDFGTPVQEKKIYKTAGNGMGGRNGTSLLWEDEVDSSPKRKRVETTSSVSNGRRMTRYPLGDGHEFVISEELSSEDEENGKKQKVMMREDASVKKENVDPKGSGDA